MINWVWAGGLIFLFGTLIAAWPEAELAAKTVTRRQRRPAVATD
jgi:cytochrome c biogenesis factor